MAEEIIGLKVVVNGQEKVVGSVGEMRKLLKEAQFEALKLSQQFGETSAEALAAAKQIALMKDQIKDASERVDLFDPGKKFQVFANAVSAAGGGIAALQGAMGLLGSESEDVQKALLKVQSALALSQGLSTIADASKDFERLSAVIQQTTLFTKANEFATKAASVTMKLFGVSVETTSVSFKVLKGAIAATGIGLLVVALGAAISYLQDFTTASEDAAEAQKKLNEAATKTAKQGLDAVVKFNEQLTRENISKAKLAGASEAEIFAIEQNGRRSRLKALQDYLAVVRNTDREAAFQTEQAIEDLNIDILVSQNDFALLQRKQAAENRAKAEEERIAAQKAALDKEYQAELDAYNKRVALRTKESQELIDASLTLSEKRAAEKKKEEEQAKIDAELLGIMQNSVLGKSIENQIAANATKLANDKATSDAAIAIATAEAESKRVLLETTASALTNLSLVAGRETVAGKALAIASSIINTYQGATKALAQGGIAGPIAAAGIIAAGLASVKQIVSVKVPGAAGGGQSVSAPSLNAGSPLNPTTIASNQVTLDQRSINAIGNKAIRAYVVESEISAAQQKVRRIQRQTTFG
jgi:hypothetical protein